MNYELFPLPDGRQLEVLVRGSQGRGLVWWTGTPGAAVEHPELFAICDRLDLRVVMPLRAGYGASTPHPGRAIADPARDLVSVLAQLGLREIVSIGFSGGGSHSLATAALVPACAAAAVVVSPAPRDAAGLDFYAGMGAANQAEWRLADLGADAVRPFIIEEVNGGNETVFENYADCFSPPDALELESPIRKEMSAGSRTKAFEHGPEGWIGDDVAMVTDWGFSLSSIAKPVTFWAGRQDWLVSWRHSAWMHERVAGSDLHILDAYGHFGLHNHRLAELIDDLVSRAGW